MAVSTICVTQNNSWGIRKIMMNLYHVSSWGPDGKDDVVILAAAKTVGLAARLADQLLAGRRDLKCSGKANCICLMAEGVQEQKTQIIGGPYSGLSGCRGAIACWKREPWHRKWAKQP